MLRQLSHVVLALVLVSGFAVMPAQAQDYDLVILNGRVMDPETNFDAVRNVGVRDGKIVVITEDAIQGAETIDASGHVVAPGFVDGHFHNVVSPFGQKLGLRDGVTSAMELEFGVLPVDVWYASWAGKAQVNYGATASLQAARETVINPQFKSISGASISDMEMGNVSHFSMDWSQSIATKDQIVQILALVEEGVRQGALGVGYTPGYMEFGVTTEEGVGAQRIAGKYGLFTAMHGRFSSQMPPSDGVQGTNEQLGSVAAHGGGLIVQHMTAQTLATTQYALDLIDAAYANGHQVVAEIYPYTFGATMVMADYLRPDNYQKNMGKTYSDIIATATMTPLTKESYDSLYKAAPHTNVTFNNATEADLELALVHPTSLIASDAFPYSVKSDGSYAQDWDTPYDAVNGHPRGAGTHAKVLQMVREQNLMPLMLAISKMSYMYAKFLQDNGVPQMAHKGRLQVGADADIIVFDPATVKQNATPANGGLPSTGIPYVVVNGTIVVTDSKVLKDVFPGQPIRLPVKH